MLAPVGSQGEGEVCRINDVESRMQKQFKEQESECLYLLFVYMVVAAIVGTERLETPVESGLVDKPKETIPMSFWWLIGSPVFVNGNGCCVHYGWFARVSL